MRCCALDPFWGGGKEVISRRYFMCNFLMVRSFKDSCNDLSGDFLLRATCSLKLCYPVLHTKQPYTIIQLFLPSEHTPSACSDYPGVCRQLQHKRTLRGLLLLSLPVPSIFIYVFQKAEFLMDYSLQDQWKVKLCFGACFVNSFGFHMAHYQRHCS